jgi:Protein of unknown function (DUF3619)
MNSRELNFAYRVRHALNENLDNLPTSTRKKLAFSRNFALSRKKQDSGLRALAHRYAVVGHAGRFFDESLSWLARMGLVMPLIVLAGGLTLIYQMEQQHRISEMAEIDALVLSDELPLSAYLDQGFNAYLANRGE